MVFVIDNIEKVSNVKTTCPWLKYRVDYYWSDLSVCHAADGPSKSSLIRYKLDTSWQGSSYYYAVCQGS